MYTDLNFAVDLMSWGLAVMLSRKKKKKNSFAKGWRILIQDFAISPGLMPGLIFNNFIIYYVELSINYELCLYLKIKKMICDTFSPLFHFKKSFKSY